MNDNYSNNIPKTAHTYGTEHIEFVDNLIELIKRLHVLKEATYRGSWAKRGHMGIFFTLVRPLDRLENIANEVSNNADFKKLFTMTFFNTLIDTSLYCIKWAALLVEIEPQMLEEWISAEFGTDSEEYLLHHSNGKINESK